VKLSSSELVITVNMAGFFGWTVLNQDCRWCVVVLKRHSISWHWCTQILNWCVY